MPKVDIRKSRSLRRPGLGGETPADRNINDNRSPPPCRGPSSAYKGTTIDFPINSKISDRGHTNKQSQYLRLQESSARAFVEGDEDFPHRHRASGNKQWYSTVLEGVREVSRRLGDGRVTFLLDPGFSRVSSDLCCRDDQRSISCPGGNDDIDV